MAQVLANPNTTLLSEPDPERQKMASRYAQGIRRAGWIFVSWVTILFFIIQVPGIATSLRDWARLVSTDPSIMVGIFVLVLCGAMLLVIMPVSYVLGYAVPRKYGLAPMATSAWLVDYVKSNGLALLSWVVIAVVYHWIVRANPNWWWLIVAILWWGTVWLTQYLWPLDRFGAKKLAPLDDIELTHRLSQLTERAGLPAMTLWILPVSKKTRTANAWFIGMGGKRRIVLTDTMLQIYNYDELEAILAHELGHSANNDIAKQVVLHGFAIFALTLITYGQIALTGSRNGLGGAADVATLTYPIIAYVMYSSLTCMISGARSRKMEAKADRYAIELTGNPDAFKSAMIKLADLNLIETHPSRRTRSLQHTHPTMGERMAMADVAAGRQAPPLLQEEDWRRPAKRVARDKAGGSAARRQHTPFVVRRIKI